ncbi:MAG TPA: twin-arginine translocation signal domain-containing protein [Acidobacteriota bacterium]|nr:twin-arginine translocation signal domain-containing protein [Acidobacteriota bacterium]
MIEESFHLTKTGRRDFLKQACTGAAVLTAGGAMAEASPQGNPTTGIPLIQLGPHKVTRLITGGNPIGGFGHSVPNMSRHMLEYFTLERTIEFLEKCVREGINTWQFDHLEKPIAALRTVRERGAKLNFICLHAERPKDAPLKTVIADMNPIAIVHHGGVTDSLFRAGKAQQVRDFVKKVRDHGVLAGVSSHCPANVRRMADEGWENDLFMTCLYYVSRPREEQQKLLGKVVVDEPFFESDPLEMTEVIRQVGKPCLAFKILAAGRKCSSQESVQTAFRFAFERIKPTDAVIVGMYPRFEDEVTLNATYARKYGNPTATL